MHSLITRYSKFELFSLLRRYISQSLILFWVYSPLSIAANIGVVAEEALEPVGFLSSFVSKMCYVIGTILIVGSLMQYKRHRDNPTEVRISKPLMLLLLGLVIALIPLVPQFLASRSGAAP